MARETGCPESCRELVRTETSWPLSAADRLVEPIDLFRYGYAEKEYAVKGFANVYEWPVGQEIPSVRTEHAPYATRILVRAPVAAEKFSGVVVVEALNYASKYDRSIPGWGHCFEYYLDRGVAWVGVTIHSNAIQALKTFDPGRYGELDFPNPLPEAERGESAGSYGKPDKNKENGLRWDMLSQLSALFRSEREDNPFAGLRVTELLMTGASGGDVTAYAAGIHPLWELPGGKPVYDGFLVYMTGAPGCINQTTPKMTELDPRAKFYSTVPCIHVLTAGDMFGGGFHPDWAFMQRRPNADEPGKKLAMYEIGGSGVRAGYDKRRANCPEDAEKTGFPWKDSVDYEYEFPVRYILRAAHEALIRWVREGVAPPRTPYLETEGEYPETRFVRDEVGNTKGGIRTPYVDAPLYLFDEEGGAKRLSPEVIRKLYASKEDYFQKAAASTLEALEGGWILKEDAVKILTEAAAEELPELLG